MLGILGRKIAQRVIEHRFGSRNSSGPQQGQRDRTRRRRPILRPKRRIERLLQMVERRAIAHALLGLTQLPQHHRTLATRRRFGEGYRILRAGSGADAL